MFWPLLRVNIIQHIMIKHFHASCIAMLKDIDDLNDMMCMLFLKDIFVLSIDKTYSAAQIFVISIH